MSGSSDASTIRSKIRILTVNDIYTTTASLLSTSDILDDISKSINLDFMGKEPPSKITHTEEPIPTVLPIGGLDILRNVYDKLTDHCENTICLLNGDILGGSQLAEHFRGESMVEILNTINPSTVCIGNHEFDYGTEQLEKLISTTHFPWLGENITVDRPVNVVPRVMKDIVQLCRKNKARQQLQLSGTPPQTPTDGDEAAPTTLSHVNNTPPCLIYDFCIDSTGRVVKKYRNGLLELLFALIVRNEITTNDYAAILSHQTARDQHITAESHGISETETTIHTPSTPSSPDQDQQHLHQHHTNNPTTSNSNKFYIYRVGVFSVCTSQTPSLAYPSKNTTFSRADTLSIAYAMILKLIGCHSCILSSHLSIRVDMEIARLSKLFSERLQNHYLSHIPPDVIAKHRQLYDNTWINSYWSLIDCIYGGHEHTCYVLQCDEYLSKHSHKKMSSGLHQTVPQASTPSASSTPSPSVSHNLSISPKESTSVASVPSPGAGIDAITDEDALNDNMQQQPGSSSSSSSKGNVKPTPLDKQLNKALDSDDDVGGDLNVAKYDPGYSNSNPAESLILPSAVTPVSGESTVVTPPSDNHMDDSDDGITIVNVITPSPDTDKQSQQQDSTQKSPSSSSKGVGGGYLPAPVFSASASIKAPSSTYIYRKNIVYDARHGPVVIKVGMNAHYTGVIDLDLDFDPSYTNTSFWNPILPYGQLQHPVDESKQPPVTQSHIYPHPEEPPTLSPKELEWKQLQKAYYDASFECISQLLLTVSMPPPKDGFISDDLLQKLDKVLQVFTETPAFAFFKTQFINTIHKKFNPKGHSPSSSSSPSTSSPINLDDSISTLEISPSTDYTPRLHHPVFSNPNMFVCHMKNELVKEIYTCHESKDSAVHPIIRHQNGVIEDRTPHQFDLVFNPDAYLQTHLPLPTKAEDGTKDTSEEITIFTPNIIHSRMRFHMIPNISTATDPQNKPPLPTSPDDGSVVYYQPTDLAQTYFHPYQPTSDVVKKWRKLLDFELSNGRDLQQVVFNLLTSFDTRSMNSRARSGVTGPNFVADAMYWSGYPLFDHLNKLHRQLHGDTSITFPTNTPSQGDDVVAILQSIPHLDGYFSCINGGFLRGDKHYPAGSDITIADILNELPFPKHQSFILIRGDDLIRGMNQQLAYVPQPSGAFPHYSENVMVEYSINPLPCRNDDSVFIEGTGVGYTALPFSPNIPEHPYCQRLETDPTNPFYTRNQDNSVSVAPRPFLHPVEPPVQPRVINVSIDGKPIRHNGFYLVSTTQFIAWGGDGLKSYARSSICTHPNVVTQTQIIRDVVISYCDHLREEQLDENGMPSPILKLGTSKRVTIMPKP